MNQPEMKRVLFVDDEPMILSALQNLLRKQRSCWDMVFVASGEEALQQMDKASFDVIVSDMRMPKMDGAALFKQVKVKHPKAVRIVLSGHAELETAMRTVTIAHQFLNKPCDAATLQSVVERACGLQALLSDEVIRSAIGTIGSLPSVPRVYMAVTRALEDPDASLKEIAKLVEQDMAVSAKVLQLVNSAFFGLPQRMSGIPQALSYLGANMLKRILLSVETFAMFEGVALDGGLSLDSLQEHGMLVAKVAAKLMSDKQRSEDAFMAGMLHDVGKLVMAVQIPGHLKKALVFAKDRGMPIHAAEDELYGFTHAEVGAYLMGLWGLPYPIAEALAHHHHPSRVPHTTFDVVDAVYVAESLVDEVVLPITKDAAIDCAHLDALGVTGELAGWRQTAFQAVTEIVP